MLLPSKNGLLSSVYVYVHEHEHEHEHDGSCDPYPDFQPLISTHRL